MTNLYKHVLTGACVLALGAVGAFGADATAGKAIYDTKCKTCHATDGNGNPGMSKALKVEIKPLSSPEIQQMSDSDLKMVVTAGFGKMKPVSGVAGGDLDNVIAYVRSLKK